ncbi:hypothetical protein HYT26_00570, partial [Candidatus Pacearchaeota archaeon]|nr:hypothetical protein [Candidatus Pacearchaeota archaeon]
MKSDRTNIFIMVLISLLLLAIGVSLSKASLSEQDFSKICSDLSKIGKTELNEKLVEAGIDAENTSLPYISEACNSLAQTDSIFTEEAKDKKIKKKQDTDVVKESRIIENKGKGRIKFNKEIIADVIDVDKNPNVYVNDNLIAVNTEELPELKEPAALIIENLHYIETPRILYSSRFTTKREEITEPCPED